MSEEDKKRVKLIRMPDGSIRPATDADTDIGNVWATQSQIRAEEVRQEQLAKEQPKLNRRLLKKAQKTAVRQETTTVAPAVEAPTTPVSQPVPIKSTSQRAVYRNQGEPAPQQVQPVVVAPKEIAISLTIPKLKKPKIPKKHAKKAARALKSAPKWAYAVAVLVALPAFLITLGVINHKPATKKPSVQGESKVAIADFQTVTPDGDITNTTSQKVTYDPGKKVASFTDKINGYEVTVSMQKLPDTFKPNIADNVKKVADQFSATTVLAVDNGSAYLGTSAKGPQSVVGYRGDLLVFMKSDTKIDAKAWAEYFNSLK
jgi:hypothetical protein